MADKKEQELKIFGLSIPIMQQIIKWCIIIGIAAIILTPISFAFFGHLNFSGQFDFTKISAFGSFLSGLVGGILTLAASLLILLTYNSQKKELEKTVEIADKQSETMRIQQFENTFFNLLKTQREIAELWDKPSEPHNFFVRILDFLQNRYNKNKGSIKKGKINETFETFKSGKVIIGELEKYAKSNYDEKEVLKLIVRDVYFLNYNSLSHFYNHLNMLIKYIDQQFESSESNNSSLYIDILANNLSISQITLYFYFILLFPEMINLVNKYNFFKRLKEDDLIKTEHTNLHQKETE